MSYQEKKSLVSLFATTLFTIGYFIYVFQVQQDGDPAALNDLQLWGKAVLILLPCQIVWHILVHIGFSIVHKMTTDEDPPAFEDERDKLIELKSSRNGHYAFMLGFMVAMAVLAWGGGAFQMFVTMICGGILSSVIESVSHLYYHRRGI